MLFEPFKCVQAKLKTRFFSAAYNQIATNSLSQNTKVRSVDFVRVFLLKRKQNEWKNFHRTMK